MASSTVALSSTQESCCLQSCSTNPSKKTIAQDCRKVEVKAFEPKKKRDKFLVAWEADGSAKFHASCWDRLIQASKGRGDLSSELTDIERSMVLEAKKTAEFHDADSTVVEEASRIASILKTSKYCIAFTGAGISTAAGIGDFRGKDGAWTKRDRVKNFGSSSSTPLKRENIVQGLRPTFTHEALQKLVDMGWIKAVISQNVDGLHQLSGIPKEKISELHGNCFTERCEDCGKVYQLKHHYKSGVKKEVGATMQEKCKRCKLSHRTGRKCTQSGCQGFLLNTIINFGDYLDSEVLETAENNAKMADAVLVLGTSLKVSPANQLVLMGPEPHRIIMCNRQTTDYDSECKETGQDGKPLGARVFCDCDKLMKEVMKKMMSPSDLAQWEGDKGTRMVAYDLERSTV